MTVTQPFNDHLLPLWTDRTLETPAFVYDQAAIIDNLENLSVITEGSSCRLLYSMKALSCRGVLEIIRPYVSGFSTSSLFECRMAREIGGSNMSVHLTSPGLRAKDMQDIHHYCNYISFNSLPQWDRYHSLAAGMQCGLRVNPGISFARDIRFDPCRPYSKLGVPLSQLPPAKDPAWLEGISGLHLHNNCESTDYEQLERTIEQVYAHAPGLLERLSWLNIGGGYLLSTPEKLSALSGYLRDLSMKHDLQLFFEPGKAIVGNAGYLVASVIDIFDSGGKTTTVLDTSVNHLPEVFEYQYRPAILQHHVDGKYSYQLAGSSCLSGDIFGEYCFDHPLEIGSRIIFSNVGAYMMVKANMFNGINLPSVYSMNRTGNLELQKKYIYDDYLNRVASE